MTLTLAFDTETSGLFKQGVDPDHESQPHICEIAAYLFDDADQEVGGFHRVIKPDGWLIEEGATAIHGITTEYALAVGGRIRHWLIAFMDLVNEADIIIAHNVQFDRRMISADMARLNPPGKADWWKVAGAKLRCTMEMSTSILKLPGKYGFKYPKLEEAHLHLVGPFTSNHRAEGDARAALRVWRAIQKEVVT